MRALPRNVFFFKTSQGNEPVREWLKSLTKEEKQIIGEDIKVVQGTLQWRKPLVDFLGSALWEIRITLPDSIARILFLNLMEK